MIKRPLNPRFTQAVLEGRKFTTIRAKPWPCWKPIMLYNWSGAAYRSPQIDVAEIEVEEVLQLEVTHDPDGGVVFSRAHIDGKPIHQCEGFDNAGQMQAWFSNVVKAGESASLHLMRFRLANPKSEGSPPSQLETKQERNGDSLPPKVRDRRPHSLKPNRSETAIPSTDLFHLFRTT